MSSLSARSLRISMLYSSIDVCCVVYSGLHLRRNSAAFLIFLAQESWLHQIVESTQQDQYRLYDIIPVNTRDKLATYILYD